MKNFWGGLALLSISGLAAANGQVIGVHIIRLQVNTSLGNYVFIQTDGIASNPASCSVNGFWQFTFPLATASSNQIYAGLVAAYMSQTPVMISGKGACNEFSTVESLDGFELSPH